MSKFMLWYILVTVFLYPFASSHAIVNSRVYKPNPNLKIEPVEALIQAGDNVSFTCSYPSNVTFHWDTTAKVRPFRVENGVLVVNGTTGYFSKIQLTAVKRIVSGEVICNLGDGEQGSAAALLIVNGVKNGGRCQSSTDCVTDRATCQNGICSCPKSNVLLRVTKSGREVCRQMIYSLYDPCEFNEECTHLVDPKSVCASNSVCVCANWALDIRGKCISKNEITYNRSQEMYRVGLIAVTCIIILIVAVSLWITLKRSCHDQAPDSRQRSIMRTDVERASVDSTTDKPPSYDDILVNPDSTSPPTIKEALKNCMTAKRLLRQASAPAGNLIQQPIRTVY